jgi:carbohydrate esterase-like sialic acid-specific acetylesterase
MRARIVVSLLLLCALVAAVFGVEFGFAETVAPPTSLFILAGQSNMIGGAKLDGVVATPSDSRLLSYHGRADWRIAEDPLVNKQGIGPGMTLGLRVLEERPSMRIGLFMCARGGTPIGEWQPKDGLYRNCISKVRATGIPVAGIFFLQGETDAKHKDAARNWEGRFLKVFAAFRKDLGSDVPFVLGQIGRLRSEYRGQGVIRDAQAEVAHDQHVPLVVSNDLSTYDGVHFTADGYHTLGVRFADAWLTAAP